MQMIKLVESKDEVEKYYHWFTYVDPSKALQEGLHEVK